MLHLGCLFLHDKSHSRAVVVPKDADRSTKASIPNSRSSGEVIDDTQAENDACTTSRASEMDLRMMCGMKAGNMGNRMWRCSGGAYTLKTGVVHC